MHYTKKVTENYKQFSKNIKTAKHKKMQKKRFTFEISVTRIELHTWKALSQITPKNTLYIDTWALVISDAVSKCLISYFFF